MLRRHVHSGQSHCRVTPLWTTGRTLKTLDVREYRPLGTPIEFRFYQRYANHPNRQSGIQFLTHYDTHQRFRVKGDYIDYMNWGREQGQARLPHRHQRVAFDFHDVLHPTALGEGQLGWFENQDPSLSGHPDLSSSFNPNKKHFSHPEHWNKMFSKRRPGEGDIRLDVLDSQSLLGPLVTQTDTQDTSYFGTETRGPTSGRVPGLNAPFYGEFDRELMQAMSRPLNKSHSLTGSSGRFSKLIYINEPDKHGALTATVARELNRELDKATNAVYSKLVVLEAAQSGKTDFFCAGVDWDAVGFDVSMAAALTEAATPSEVAADEPRRLRALEDAARYRDRADEVLREHAALLWRAYTAPRPLMTMVNGRCSGTGCGLALAAKYCALRDTSEFIFDGPQRGLVPFGGLTRLLARPESSLKYPGLAEFVMLTGTSLFAGDVLRLGWTDLFTSLPDMSYHIKEWFDASEHMHNDAVAWQLGHLLDTCFRMKDGHSSAMERCAITPIRAQWVEDVFADQPSVEAVLGTLSEVELLPLDSPHNTCDPSLSSVFTLASVADGVRQLEQCSMRYALSPWDITAPAEEVHVQPAATLFTAYVLERRGGVDVAVHANYERQRRWRAQREREYIAYADLQSAPHRRHVYVRLEGCEGRLVDFDFTFTFAVTAHVGESTGLATELGRLKQQVLAALDMPATRELDLGWYVPTLDTCPVRTDAELRTVLHVDPGVEDPAANLTYPPVYFIVKRRSLYLSEWAYAVKHQLLLQCPYALKATWAMLHEVRGSGAAEAIPSLADTLAIEYKYTARLMRRADFYAVGQHTNKSVHQWRELQEERTRNVHKAHRPTRPLADFSRVFERDTRISGHSFRLRPRWSPRTLEEVPDESIASLRDELSFEAEQLVALDPAVYAAKAARLEGMLEDAGGLEVVPHLGEEDAGGTPRVPPLASNAHVPDNVNFYVMARHPWDDTPSSWRRDGFTAGSEALYKQQYEEAVKAVYDAEGRGAHTYWPSKAAVEGTGEPTSKTAAGAALLQSRLFGELDRAGRGVEDWARSLRERATSDKLHYQMEIASPQEKIYDDEYYRWFIQPGHHPNPSGLLFARRQAAAKPSEDAALESFINTMLAQQREDPSADGSEAAGDAAEGEEGDLEHSVEPTSDN